MGYYFAILYFNIVIKSFISLMNTPIPNGFEPWQPNSPFMKYIADLGTLYMNPEGNILALNIQDRHTNMHGFVHGGMLATLADCALGQYIAKQAQSPVVTVQMSVDYLNPVKSGDWLEAQVSIDKKGRGLVYATCLLKVKNQLVFKANAVFLVRSPRQQASDS